jgi:hypothetical protein
MKSREEWVSIALATLSIGLVSAHFAWSREAVSIGHSQTKDRARIVLSKPLSKLDGGHLKAVLVEVHYGAKPRHRTPTPARSWATSSRGKSERR